MHWIYGKNDDNTNNTNNRMNNYNNRWYQLFYRKIKTEKTLKKLKEGNGESKWGDLRVELNFYPDELMAGTGVYLT